MSADDCPLKLPEERRAAPNCAENVAMIRMQMETVVKEIDDYRRWKVQHERKGKDLEEMHADIRDLVKGLRWLRITIRVTAAIGGVLTAAVVFINEIWPLWDRIKH